MDAVGPRLVRGGRDHAALLGRPADYDGLAPPLGMVELLDAREERVEVEQAHRGPAPASEEPLEVTLGPGMRRGAGFGPDLALVVYAPGIVHACSIPACKNRNSG